jgi:hypothetical protein
MRLEGHDRVREIELWEKLKEEQLKKGDFDISDVNKHQIESYAKRWREQMAVGQLTNQADLYRHSKANLETLEADQKNGTPQGLGSAARHSHTCRSRSAVATRRDPIPDLSPRTGHRLTRCPRMSFGPEMAELPRFGELARRGGRIC